MPTKPNYFKGYTISKNYRRLIVYTFRSETCRLIVTTTMTPGPKLPRKQRYTEMKKWLETNGIDAPAYEPAVSE